MSVSRQLTDVIRLAGELDEFKAKRERFLASGDGRDSGKLASHDAVIAEAEAHLEAAKALVPPEALELVAELRAAQAKYDAAVAEVDALMPTQNATATSAAATAHDATVRVEEN